MRSELLFVCVAFSSFFTLSDANLRTKKSILFPLRSLSGIFFAIAVPVDLPDQNIFVSYNFESNYYLPFNTTELGDMTFLAPITEVETRNLGINRRLAYDVLEDKFKKSGYPGRACLLRSICEAAEIPVDHQGVLGGIMHVIFTPSSSKDESLPTSYYLAEKQGNSGDCSSYVKECPSGLFDAISKIIHFGNIDI